MYLVIHTTHTRTDYAFHSGDAVSIVAVYTTPQAANAAAARHFIDLQTSHSDVHCNDCGGLLQVVAEGGREADQMVYVEEHEVNVEESTATTAKLTDTVRRAGKVTRKRVREEERKQEEEDGGYDSYGKPISQRRGASQASNRSKDTNCVAAGKRRAV